MEVLGIVFNHFSYFRNSSLDEGSLRGLRRKQNTCSQFLNWIPQRTEGGRWLLSFSLHKKATRGNIMFKRMQRSAGMETSSSGFISNLITSVKVVHCNAFREVLSIEWEKFQTFADRRRTASPPMALVSRWHFNLFFCFWNWAPLCLFTPFTPWFWQLPLGKLSKTT